MKQKNPSRTVFKEVDEDNTPRVSYNSYLYTFWLHISNIMTKEFGKNATKIEHKICIQVLPVPYRPELSVHRFKGPFATAKNHYLAVCRESN